MKVGTPHTCSPEKPRPSDSDDDIDEVPKLVAQQTGPGAQATSACAPLSSPVLHPLLRLPYELWQVIASYLIMDSPFLKRPGQPTPHFPIASTMRDLGSLSLGSAHLREIVRKLRKEPRFHPWRELAGRALYEFHKKSEVGRQLAIELYGIDPVFPTVWPQLLNAAVYSPAQSQELCASLERNCQQVQELRLNIKSDRDTEELSRALGRCTHLNRLVLSTNDCLSGSFFSSLTSGLRLDSLTIRSASLEAEVLAEIARGGAVGRAGNACVEREEPDRATLESFATGGRTVADALRHHTGHQDEASGLPRTRTTYSEDAPSAIPEHRRRRRRSRRACPGRRTLGAGPIKPSTPSPPPKP